MLDQEEEDVPIPGPEVGRRTAQVAKAAQKAKRT